MKQTMVIVADGTLARFFTIESARSPLTEIEAVAHPDGRAHDREITSDLPGKGAGGGSSKHSYEGETDPKKHNLAEFAKLISDSIENARNANTLSNLLLVAPPALLGEIRRHLSSEANKKVVFELDKNLTHHSVEDIRDHLPKYLTH